MRVTIDQAALKVALGPVERATAKGNTPLMVLKNVLIDATDGQVRLSGTDEITSVAVTVDGTILSPGATTIEADMLAGLVATLPAGMVTITAIAEHTVTVESAGNTSKLRSIVASDFPELPTIADATAVVTVKADYFARMIDRVGIAAAKEESRPQLFGINLKLQHGVLTMVAGDGGRAAIQSIPLDHDEVDVAYTVSITSMRQLAAILVKADSDVTFGITERGSHMVATHGSTTWTGRVLPGTFPDFAGIVPKALATTVVMTRDQALIPVKRSLLFTRTASDKLRSIVDLTVTAGEDDLNPGSLDLSAYDMSGSDTVTTVPSVVAGPDQSLTINGQFLSDALASIDTSQVLIGINGPTQAVVMRIPGNDQFAHLIMPMERKVQR